jgi:hypothetical protein
MLKRILCAIVGHSSSPVYSGEDVQVYRCRRCEQLLAVLSMAAYLKGAMDADIDGLHPLLVSMARKTLQENDLDYIEPPDFGGFLEDSK